MKGGLHDGDTVVLQHVEESCLSCIVEAEEKELGVLVEKTKRRENVVDCGPNSWSASMFFAHVEGFPQVGDDRGCIHQLIIHMAESSSTDVTVAVLVFLAKRESGWLAGWQSVDGDG